MKPAEILGALVGAVIGAAIWGGIAAATGFEIGYVAWGIGGLVGFGARYAGGRGQTCGIVCAVLALLSIFGGKMFAVQIVLGQHSDEFAEIAASQEGYEEFKAAAEEFAKIDSEEDYPNFMVDQGLTDAASPGDVTGEQLAEFTENVVPRLESFASTSPSYESWKAEMQAQFASAGIGVGGLASAAQANLGPIDILFALLGLATAFKVGSGFDEE